MNRLMDSLKFCGVLAFVVIAESLLVFGQVSTETVTLQLNQSVNREIRGGESHSYSLKLKSGQYSRFTVEQKNIELVISLFAPNGELQTEFDTKGDEYWRETLTAVNDIDSEFRILIRPRRGNAFAGSYEIKLNEAGTATERDVKRMIAEVCLNNGRKANELRNLDLSDQQLQASLKLWREIGDRYWEGVTLLNIGWGYTDSGEGEKAIAALDQALTIFTQIGDKTGERKILSALGNVNSDLSRYEKAIDYQQRSLAIARETGARRAESAVYVNLGNTYTHLALFQKALDYYLQALRIFDEINETGNRALLLNSIGSVYTDLGNYKEALNNFQKSLAIAIETDDLAATASIFNNMGGVYTDFERYDDAVRVYESALDCSRRLNARGDEATTLNNLGAVYFRLKQYEKARVHFEQSLAISVELKQLDTQSYALKNLLGMYVALENPKLAIFYGKKTINVFQEIRANIKSLDKATRDTYIERKEKYYRILSDVLISEGRIPEAQNVLDLLKIEEYGQITIHRGGGDADRLPYSTTETDVAAKVDNLATLGRRAGELEKSQKEKGTLTVDEQTELSAVRSEIETANKAFRLALEALGKSDESVEEKVSEIQSEKNLQRILGSIGRDLGTGAVALYTVIGTYVLKDDSAKAEITGRAKFGWIIMVTPESRKAYPIDVTELEQTVFDFRSALSSDKYDPRFLAEKLYTKLFRQTSDKQKTTLEQDLETYFGNYREKTLMWSLDGVLRYVPMAALHDGKGYLVEKFRSVMFTRQSLALLSEKDSPTWKVLGLGVSEAKTIETAKGAKISFSALAGTRQELEDIVREPSEKTGIIEGTRKLDRDFTKESALKLWQEGNYQVVHIASHFSFNPTDQTESFLLLGDGKLTFADIQDKDNLFGSVDLLTLSACDTAMGGNGKESEGFAYLAQSLGAKTVIASLWQVSDAGTPELMLQFYKLRGADPGITKGEAFRRAQLSLLIGSAKTNDAPKTVRAGIVGGESGALKLPLFIKDPKKPLAHPFYWSSFVLIGNWR